MCLLFGIERELGTKGLLKFCGSSRDFVKAVSSKKRCWLAEFMDPRDDDSTRAEAAAWIKSYDNATQRANDNFLIALAARTRALRMCRRRGARIPKFVPSLAAIKDGEVSHFRNRTFCPRPRPPTNT